MSNVDANTEQAESTLPEAKEICFASEANEIFFGVVGHVGSGTGFIAEKLKTLISGRGYEPKVIKASTAIRIWAEENNHHGMIPPSGGRSEISHTEKMQTLGDMMRQTTNDYAAVAQGVIELIRKQRAEWTGATLVAGEAVQPDPKKPRAYIIESIRHPAEVNLLRLIYGNAFALIGVVCHEDEREERLCVKYFERDNQKKKSSLEQVQDLMERDAEDQDNDHGQHVADSFWESDYFLDNSVDEKDTRQFHIDEDLGRLIDIISHSKIVRPTISETGMHVAVSAQIRSSCLSKQVGAAILDQDGNVLAIGTNEVPKAGGGVYGENQEEEIEDWRCNACESPHCSSNADQNEIIQKLIKAFPALKKEGDESTLLKNIRKVGLGGLLEFSRAVHAEMDAVTTAARSGVSVKGSSVFVTAFPCHYCARHLVAAGVDQVQFIEPYPKSRALSLHGDSITDKATGWKPPSAPKDTADRRDDLTIEPKFRTVGNPDFGRNDNKHKVLFKPFVGVAPRLYNRAFSKDRSLKDKVTGEQKIGSPDWGGKWGVRMLPYTDLEARLTKETGQ